MSAAIPFIACHDCDLLQREPALQPGMLAMCPRCGAVLRRRHAHDIHRRVALTLTCAVLFILANAFPIVSLEARGMQVACTLLEAIDVLWREHIEFVAALVFLTAFALPGLELGLMLAVLLAPQPRIWMLRLIAAARPWAMIDVFVLALLVSVRKLADMATIIPGVAFWSLCALMLLLVGVRGGFHLHEYWSRLPLRHDTHAS